MTDDPDVIKPLSFLREREIVHFQRFGEALNKVRDYVSNEHTFVMPKTDLCEKNKEKKKGCCCGEKGMSM